MELVRARQERARRLFVIALATMAAAIFAWQEGLARSISSDFELSLQAARFLAHGVNPYEAIGPGRAYDWGFPYLYPLTAAVAVLPLAWLPTWIAEVIFFAGSAGLLAWVLTRESTRNPQLWLFASWAFLFTAETVQWSPLVVASTLFPSLGFFLAAKPTVGAALFLAYPTRRAALLAGGFGLATILIWPWWVRAWLAVLPAGQHVIAPITLAGGPLVLLTLLKWRRQETRLLVALAAIPHTVFLYEAIPLFLIVRRFWEGALLSTLTFAAWLIAESRGPYASYNAGALVRAQCQLWLLYLPCMVMVLTRPNVASPQDPAAAVVASYWSRLRGT